MADPKAPETAPTVAPATQAIVVQGQPLASLPTAPPRSSETEPGGLYIVDGRVVDANGNEHRTKGLDKDGNVVDRKAPPDPENPDKAEIERLKAELAAAKADADAKTKAKDAK